VKTGIHADELTARRELLLEHVAEQKLDGYVLFDEKYIQYFTGFGFLATERPVAFVGSASGELVVFVPEFEVERVRAETDFERVESYPEYPGLEHPMQILARVL
jgi:Xaa-Pro dipeptidase